MANHTYEPRTRAQFHRDPVAQKLLRQFMKNGGEGGGVARSDDYRAGHEYAFDLTDEQKKTVDELREKYEGLGLADAIALMKQSQGDKP
jgi:hypothetical protein